MHDVQSHTHLKYPIRKDEPIDILGPIHTERQVSVDSRNDASIHAWKEYIRFNCIIHTKHQYQH